jgi:hypothetical protein
MKMHPFFIMIAFFLVFASTLFTQTFKKYCYKITAHNTIRFLSCACNCPAHQNNNTGRCLRCSHRIMITGYPAVRSLIAAELRAEYGRKKR